MPLNGTNILEKINHINSINHKIIRNCPEQPSAGQNQQESTKCTNTGLTRLKRCLVSIFMILNKINRLTFITRKAQLFERNNSADN